MSYDIEKELNKIENDLEKSLRDGKIVDENGKPINIQEFNRLLDKAIEKCFEMLKELELSKNFDADANNRIFSFIEGFRTMKSNHEFSLAEEQKDDHEQQVIARYNKRDEKSDGKRASRLRRALSRVLDKIARDRKDPTSDEYVR